MYCTSDANSIMTRCCCFLLFFLHELNLSKVHNCDLDIYFLYICGIDFLSVADQVVSLQNFDKTFVKI